MEKLIFATNNRNKVDEIRRVLDDSFELITLAEAGIDRDIPEPHATFEENALEKSRTIHRLTGLNCFSEDTGLEVQALGGEPGVRSARYAGNENDAEKNMKKLLASLQGKPDRSARFRTVISLIREGKEHFFTGICNGKITDSPRGDKGFGYDPIFIPDGATHTFAEMGMDEKNRFSHRKKATQALIEFLKSNS